MKGNTRENWKNEALEKYLIAVIVGGKDIISLCRKQPTLGRYYTRHWPLKSIKTPRMR